MDPGTLASGSQDGIMKFFDLRSFEMVAQFASNTGSVRDLQFNPHSFYQVSTFSSGSKDTSKKSRTTYDPEYFCSHGPDPIKLFSASIHAVVKYQPVREA